MLKVIEDVPFYLANFRSLNEYYANNIHSFFYDDKEIVSDLVMLLNFYLESKYFLLKMPFQLQIFEKGHYGEILAKGV